MSMQVILMEKVANLGNLGDVVKVKDGFARNYLIPHGKAKRATPENIKHFEGRRAELEKAQNETLAKAQERAAKLENLKLQISQKAGVDGRLFGSVTNYDIVEALEKQGHDVQRSQGISFLFISGYPFVLRGSSSPSSSSSPGSSSSGTGSSIGTSSSSSSPQGVSKFQHLAPPTECGTAGRDRAWIYIQWQTYTIQNCQQVNHKLTTGNPQPLAQAPFVLKNMRAQQANRAPHAGFFVGAPEVSLGNPVPRRGWGMIRGSSSDNKLCHLGRNDRWH